MSRLQLVGKSDPTDKYINYGKHWEKQYDKKQQEMSSGNAM